MFVEVIVWGGSTLIGGLATGYYFLHKFDKKIKENHSNSVPPKESMKGIIEKANNFKIREEDCKGIAVRDQLHSFATLYHELGFINLNLYKEPKYPDYKNSHYRDVLSYNDKREEYEDALSKTTSIERVVIDFHKRKFDEIHDSKEIDSLMMKYSYVWTTYEEILVESKCFGVSLSAKVKNEMRKGMNQFIDDYISLKHQIESREKQLKDEMDAATNESFMKRLQLERDYINKIRNKEEFDLSLEKL